MLDGFTLISSVERISSNENAISGFVSERILYGNIPEYRLRTTFPESSWIWRKFGEQVVLIDKETPVVRGTLDKIELLKAINRSNYDSPILASSLPPGARRALLSSLSQLFFVNSEEKTDFGVRFTLTLQWQSQAPKGANSGTIEFPRQSQEARSKGRAFLEGNAIPVYPPKLTDGKKAAFIDAGGLASFHYDSLSTFERARKAAWGMEQFGVVLDELKEVLEAEVGRIQRETQKFPPSSGLLSELPTELRAIIESIIVKEFKVQGYGSAAELEADLSKVNVMIDTRLSIQVALQEADKKPNIVSLIR